MKKFILVLSLCLAGGLMSCERKGTVEKDVSERTQPTANLLEEGVVIGNQLQEDTLKGSLKAYAKGGVGEAEFKITYHAPAVRGRIIWGGLVPFDRVWVTGAHMATTIESNIDFTLNNQSISAGKYGLFTIPGKDAWTVIINKNWQQHLSDEYDMKDDVARMEIIPAQRAQHQERLQYEVIVNSENELMIKMAWEKLQLQIPITINH